jgi:hypothetical protein
VILIILNKTSINFSFLYDYLGGNLLRTNCGIQYADLSSFTLHVVQSELRKSSNVVLNPMASRRDQGEFHYCYASHRRTTRAHDSVKVAARSAEADDWVDTSIEDRFVAW